VKAEGDTLIGRGAHTVVAADSQVVLYGGSAEFQRNVGHCTRYFNDVYVMKTGALLFSVSDNMLKMHFLHYDFTMCHCNIEHLTVGSFLGVWCKNNSETFICYKIQAYILIKSSI